MQPSNWQEFYSGEAERYDNLRYGSRYGRAFRAAHRAVFTALLQRHASRGAVLDIASGTGQLLPCLEPFADRVYACDLTPEMMLVSRRAHGEFATFVQADATNLPFPDRSFQTVVSSRFLHLFPNDRQDAFLQEMARVLEPGGILVVDFYNSLPRKLLAPFLGVYRRLRCKRREHDSYRSPASAAAALRAAGFDVVASAGVGSYAVAPLLWLPSRVVAAMMARGVAVAPPFAEQWIIVGRRA